MEGRIMVPGEEAALQKDTEINDGVMAKKDTSNDNAHTDKRK